MELMAAKEWRLTPSQFWKCTEQDQAFMIAYIGAEARMRVWEDQEYSRKSDLESRKKSVETSGRRSKLPKSIGRK
jgi:hypothetical protein